ncbi:hypothetical protein SAY87_004163 [Trapa incisa]|uniref:Dual specificity protein phosphatase PHS1 n=1 Tax=Trapa incisa TaxID=236973 RepID=A0AAN7JNC8_9MYRT|nr:hypothetical protein SAY87_004163 [Trapa incisa]
MSREQRRDQPQPPLQLNDREDDREVEPLGSEEPDAPLPLTVTSRLLYMLGDITAGPAYKFSQWLELVRKRSSTLSRASGFPHRHLHDTMLSSSPSLSCISVSDVDTRNALPSPVGQGPEVSLWERLGKATPLDIESSSFSWNMLSSLHHTEHSTSTEHSEDEMNKALEVTVNSGGVVFFALFRLPESNGVNREAVAVIKISSSRMATQSERLGYEFAKWLGIRTPQARVVHNSGAEWQQIKEAAEKAREAALAEGDEIGEMTCTELLEALELSRCLFLMSYVHGSPLLESSVAFETRETAEKTAAAIGRIFMLDLVLRNEDRLPCRQLRWRGNPANLLLADKMASKGANALDEAIDSAVKRYRPRVIRALQKERRSTSVDSRMGTHKLGLVPQVSDLSDIMESSESSNMSQCSDDVSSETSSEFYIVAIDTGVPRRPPAGKRANDQTNYPKLVELLLNSTEYSMYLLHEITGGKLGFPAVDENESATNTQIADIISVVHEFRGGFRAALRDLQGFYIFLLTLHQKLDYLLRSFLSIINRTSSGEFEKEELGASDSPSQPTMSPCPSAQNKERNPIESQEYSMDSDWQRTPAKSYMGNKEISESSSPLSRENWHGKLCKGSAEQLRSLRLTTKLRDFHKFAKVDVETSRDLEQWNEMLKNEAVKLCQENNFNMGFFEGSDNNSVIDAYELKVRLEHILERIALISEAASTEKPSAITNSMFIGGALAARSVFTLQQLGITHILCLCANEIGQSDSQYPDLFEYKNFSISDEEDTNISSIFEEACDFIDLVEQKGGKVLVHCFEGRSRSATLVLAHLMLRKNYTLLEAWNNLKRVHRRAQPNDGFGRILLDLDRKLHGKVSLEWHKRKPTMKVCPICGKNAGLSSSSLKLHLQKAHKKLSSGSVDSAMTMEIQKALTALKMSSSGSVSPLRDP